MDKTIRKLNADIDIKVPIGNMIFNVFCINYEAPTPGWGYGNHSHSSYELHFIPSGKGRLQVGDKRYSIEAGSFYLTGPGVFHEQKADYIDPMSEFCINFEFRLSRKKRTKDVLYLQNEVDAIAKTFLSTDFWFGKDLCASVRLFEIIMTELENKVLGYYSYIQSLITQIIINALRCFKEFQPSNYSIPQKNLSDSRRHEMDKYFSNPDSTHSRKELADKIGVSVRQLNRVVHDYYAMSYKERQIYAQLEQAKHFLVTTSLSVAAVCEKSGFSSHSYFSKLFKKVFGVTPSDYKKNAANNISKSQYPQDK